MFAPAAIAGLLAAVSVQGATTCPTPQAVEARLRPLLAGGEGAVGEVRLEREGPALHVALYSPDGRLNTRRTVTGAHSCEALADAAAVIVAAWQGDAGVQPLLAADTPPGAASSDVRANAPAPVASIAGAWGLGAAAGLSLAGTRPAAAGTLTAIHAPLPHLPWAGRLGFVYQWPRESALPGGKLRWQRWVLELGPQLEGAGGPWRWAVHAGGAAGLTQLLGVGLEDPRLQQDLGLGITGGARLALGRSSLRPFLELGVRGWPTRIVAYEGVTGRQVAISRVEGLLTLGAALGR
jgi:hypothetical protein